MLILLYMQNPESCRRALNEWRTNVTKSAVEKNWRKLFNTLDGAYTVMHICEDADELEYNLVTNYVYMIMAKLMFGYIYTDRVLYGEYLLSVFRRIDDTPIDLLRKIHEKANDKNDVTIDEIKQYVIKLLTAIINYVYTPY